MPRVLSLQSFVAAGHVGNRVATFALERLGVEVLAVPSAILSNHTGHPTVTRASFGAPEVNQLLAGLEELGALRGLDAVLVGYTGSARTVAAAARAIDAAKAQSPDLIVVVDPAMGDEGRGMFVPDDVAQAVAELLVPRATVLTPNRFECLALLGRDGGESADLLGAIAALRSQGPEAIVVTSAGDASELVEVVVADERAWSITTPRLELAVGGAGDLLAAVLTAGLSLGATLVDATVAAVDATAAVLAETVRLGSRELALIVAQDQLLDPPRLARTRRIG